VGAKAPIQRRRAKAARIDYNAPNAPRARERPKHPPRGTPEPCASRRLGGRVSSNTPRAAPQRPQPRGKKGRPSASYSGRASQRARAEQRHQRHRASINIHIVDVIIVRSGAYF
jgi:hypothetical protein